MTPVDALNKLASKELDKWRIHMDSYKRLCERHARQMGYEASDIGNSMERIRIRNKLDAEYLR